MSSAALALVDSLGLGPRRLLADRVIVEFAAADDVRSGMERAVATLRRGGGADRVEWWAPAEDGSSFRLLAAAGWRRGRRRAVPAGPAGALVVSGDGYGPEFVPAVTQLARVLRRRFADEQLAEAAVRLARRSEALEDFAALVAHELKTPLHAALLQDDPSVGVEQALDLVDSLLEAARSESCGEASAPAAECLDEALRDLGPIDVEVIADLPARFSLPPPALRLILRNLVANAVAADARQIHVAAVAGVLVVDDNGVGLAEPSRYASGNRVGLALCRRVAARFGGSLELAQRTAGGTRATLAIGAPTR